VFITESQNNSKEAREIFKITTNITLPFLENDLNKFCESIRLRFNLSPATRMYIMLPIRKSFCDWHLQIIAKTSNLHNKETNIILKMDEGAVGYAFQSIDENSRYQARYIPLLDLQNLPSNYKHLSENNKNLVRADNIGYLTIPIFDKDFLVGVFIVDSSDYKDLIHFENRDLHREIFDWIGSEPIFITLLWRLKSNGS
jgi:hypothetical protein